MEKFNVDTLLKSVFTDDGITDIREAFEQKLLDYNISKTKSLKLLNIDKDVFEEIVNGTAKQPNLINIIKIAEFLEVDINVFIRLVIKNQCAVNFASIDNARKTTFLLRNFDIKMLTKLGFFGKDDTTDQLVDKVLFFFGYDSIQQYEEQLEEPLYSRTKRNLSDKMKDFWIKSAYQTFKVINNPNCYDRTRLKELIVKIKPYSQDVRDGFFTVCKALYNIGVTVIIQGCFSSNQVIGGTFIINNKPCIILTDVNKCYPTIWYALLHELHHVLFDFDLIETICFHLSGDNDVFLIEEKADSFARDFFLSEEKFHYIKRYINNSFLVSKFAKENEIHKSLVYSLFTWYQENLYGKNYQGEFCDFYPAYKNSLMRLNPISWAETCIKDASEKIKSILEIN